MTTDTETQRQAETMQVDREDILALLSIRFGLIPESVVKAIHDIEDPPALERLVLVAANVPNWQTFLDELKSGLTAFKIIGQSYNPIDRPETKE